MCYYQKIGLKATAIFLNCITDGVCPVDNPPTTSSTLFFLFIFLMMTYDTGQVTCDMWHMTRYTWHMTCDTWHTGGSEKCLRILASNGLGCREFWRYFHKPLPNEWNINRGVCRRAPATQGLFITFYSFFLIFAGPKRGLPTPGFSIFVRTERPTDARSSPEIKFWSLHIH